MTESELWFEAVDWASPLSNGFWIELRRLTGLPTKELISAIDDLTDREDIPTGVLLVVFHAVWHAVLFNDAPELRSLRLPFEMIESRARREGFHLACQACRSMCPFLAELIDDDLNWTGFLLPGESG